MARLVLRTDAEGPETERGFYPAREDTALLARALDEIRPSPHDWLVEVGCGNGTVALEAARRGFRTLATDLNLRALRHVRHRAQRVGGKLDTARIDLLRGLRAVRWILFNPPYLPTLTASKDPDPLENLALDGGPDGWAVSRRFLEMLPDRLSPGGKAWLVASSRQSTASRKASLAQWKAQGGRSRRRETVAFGGERIQRWEFSWSGGSRQRGAAEGRPADARRTRSLAGSVRSPPKSRPARRPTRTR